MKNSQENKSSTNRSDSMQVCPHCGKSLKLPPKKNSEKNSNSNDSNSGVSNDSKTKE